ncbi:MAG: hypothetical protein WD037_03995 [Balneolales bacterium]
MKNNKNIASGSRLKFNEQEESGWRTADKKKPLNIHQKVSHNGIGRSAGDRKTKKVQARHLYRRKSPLLNISLSRNCT